MKLFELYDTAFQYTGGEEDDMGSYTYEFFDSSKVKIECTFDRVDSASAPLLNQICKGEGVYDFNFTRANRIKITGTGGKDVVQIFATVIRIIDDFIRTHQPGALAMSAIEQSRRKYYDRLASRYNDEHYVAIASGEEFSFFTDTSKYRDLAHKFDASDEFSEAEFAHTVEGIFRELGNSLPQIARGMYLVINRDAMSLYLSKRVTVTRKKYRDMPDENEDPDDDTAKFDTSGLNALGNFFAKH